MSYDRYWTAGRAKWKAISSTQDTTKNSLEGILEQQTIVTSKLSIFSRMHLGRKFGSEISFCEISEKVQSYHKFELNGH